MDGYGKTGIIYKATNKIHGKIYIGQTTRTLEKRKPEHKNRKYNGYFSNAVRKYGINGFNWEIICDGIPEGYLDEYEIFYIDFYSSYRYGYNGTEGGKKGYSITKEVKKKISNAHKGKKVSEETKEKMSMSQKGRIISEKHKRKISNTLKGKFPGEKNPSAKLNWQKIRKIREKWNTEKYTQNMLAGEYNVRQTIISGIINNRSWHDKNYSLLGSRNLTAKNKNSTRLTWDKARSIRQKYTNGMCISEIVKQYNVTRGAVDLVLRNKTWYDPNYIYNRRLKIRKKEYPNIIEKWKTGKYTLNKLAGEYDVCGHSIDVILQKFMDSEIKLIKEKNIHRFKINDKQAMEAWNRYNEGEKAKDLAKEYGISNRTLSTRFRKIRENTDNK